MFDGQETGLDGKGRLEAGPPDEEVVRLSGRIAEIHEHLGRAHRARAEFERAGGRPGPDAVGPEGARWYRPGDPLAPSARR